MASPRKPGWDSLPNSPRRGSLGPLDMELDLPDGYSAFPRRFYLKEKYQDGAISSPTHTDLVLPGINEGSTKCTFKPRTVLSPAETRRLIRVSDRRASLTHRRRSSADHTASLMNVEFGQMKIADSEELLEDNCNVAGTDGRRLSLPVLNRHPAESMKSSVNEPIEKQIKLFECVPPKEHYQMTCQVEENEQALPHDSLRLTRINPSVPGDKMTVHASGRRSSLRLVDEQHPQHVTHGRRASYSYENRHKPINSRRASFAGEARHQIADVQSPEQAMDLSSTLAVDRRRQRAYDRRASFGGQERQRHVNVRRASLADMQRPQQGTNQRAAFAGIRTNHQITTDKIMQNDVQSISLNHSCEPLQHTDEHNNTAESSANDQAHHPQTKRVLERSMSFQHSRGSSREIGSRRRYSVICAPKEIHEVAKCTRETEITTEAGRNVAVTCCNDGSDSGDAAFETKVGYQPKPCWCFRCLLMTHMFNMKDDRLAMWGNYPCFRRQNNAIE